MPSFEQYISAIEDGHRRVYGDKYHLKLSPVKSRILKELWGRGTSLPREWIRSDKLLKITRQKYFDRRIRELRDETGCDIETGNHEGQAAYRLRSLSLRTVKDRSYLTASQKAAMLSKHDYKCAVCGRKFNKLERGLEADHKVPLMRGGGSTTENWQPLCTECNVSKRRSCQGCQDECNACAWAFPERGGSKITIHIAATTLQELRAEAQTRHLHLQDLVVKYLESGLAKKS